MKYTFNSFKEELKNMDNKERKEKLKELQTDLMYVRTRAYGSGQVEGESKIWVLRKMVAITKTAIKCWR